MLTDADVQKLSKTLATKADARGLGKRMSGIEIRLGSVETRVGGIEISFLNFQQSLDERISRLENKIDRLANSIDKLTEAIDTLRLEYAAIKGQLARHEEWIKQIAEKAGVKLEY